MKVVFSTLFFFIYVLNFGQTKKMRFYNSDFKEVTETEYYLIADSKVNLKMHSINDSTIVNFYVQRKTIGQLDANHLNEFKNYLKDIGVDNIENEKSILLHYLTENKEEIKPSGKTKATIFKKKFLKDIEKNKNIVQIWISNPDIKDLKFYHYPKIAWKVDNRLYIKNLFFPVEIFNEFCCHKSRWHIY